jgi:uncharacterized protein (TIRG00374 family)
VADDLTVGAPSATGRGRNALIRYLVGLAIGVGVLLLLTGRRGELGAAVRQVGHASPGWVAAAIAAEAGSLFGYATLQHLVLRASGTRISLAPLFVLTVASNAIANTVPGEPVVSSAYRFRWYTRRGASRTSAGWTVFTIIIAQAIGMSLLLLLGALVALAAGGTAGQARAGIAGLVIVVAAGAVLARRDLVLRLAAAAVRWGRRFPRVASSAARVEAAIDRMRQIPLPPRTAAAVIAVATSVWLADFGCLLCGFAAVHAAIPWRGVLLAYCVATVAGTLPVVPGGIGIIEGSLAVILVAYGAGRVPALSGVLVFRAVSFWLAIAVGWAIVALLARQPRRPLRGTR